MEKEQEAARIATLEMQTMEQNGIVVRMLAAG
jgi:hypothetical protein